MGFDARRLRKAELIAGGGGVILAAVLFLLPCFAAHGPHPGQVISLDGWHALTTMRWLLLLTVLAAVAVVLLTASQPAPALPVVASMLACVLGGVSALALLFRVIDHGGLSSRAGIYLGLAAAVIVGYGGFLSLRTESGGTIDPTAIETVPIGEHASSSAEPTSAGRSGS